MGYVLTGLLMLGFLLAFVFVFVKATPSAIASTLRMLGPLLTVLVGLALSAAGRFGYGVPLLLLGALWWYHNRKNMAAKKKARLSVFRTAWLEILINQETGHLDGLVLTGPREGKILSGMTASQLLEFYNELQSDQDSADLLESYLDRHIPGWREDTDTGSRDRKGRATGTSAMTKQEAYQILGLEPGAGPKEIASSHRRLAAVFSSEDGTSVYFVDRIDEARDTLLN